MYVKDKFGGYTNSAHVQGAWAFNTGSNWIIQVSITGVAGVTDLSGSWPTEAECQEAIRELFDGVDPATYGD